MASNFWSCKKCFNANHQQDNSCLSCGYNRTPHRSQHSATEKGNWECYACTYINKPGSNKCGACYSPHPASGPNGKRNGRRQKDSDDDYDVDFEESWKPPQKGRHHRSRGRKFYDDEDGVNEVRMVLLGKTGSGKSATGNTILNGDYFQSQVSGSSVTSRCSRRSAARFGKSIHLVDTPGIFDTSAPNDKVQREIVKCIGMTSPGPHAFILVLNVCRFTTEEEESINHFIEYFGDDVLDYMIVLFTRKDDLKHEGITLDEHIRKSPPALKEIIRKCGNRTIAFNNRETGSKRDNQVQDLLTMVEDMIRKSRGSCYTNEHYQEAEHVMRQREAEIRRDRKEKQRRERKRIEQEIEEKYKREYSSHTKREEKLELRIAELESEREFHDSRAAQLNDDIEDLEKKIAQQKKHGKADPSLKRRLKEMETELDKLKLKGNEKKLQNDIQDLQDELRKMKKHSKKMQKEKERQMEERLQEQERRFAEMQPPREVARNEVETGKGQTGDALLGGIISLGKLLWKGLTSLF